MNGADFDLSYDNYRAIADLEEKNPKAYCLRVLAMHRRAGLYASLYTDKVKYMRDQISKNEIDSKTLEIADEILHNYHTDFLLDFDKHLIKYHKILRRQVRKFRNRVIALNIIQQSLQLIIIIGSALVFVLIYTSNINKSIPLLISALVSVSAFISKVYHFGEKIINNKDTFEEIENEYNLYNSGRGDYSKLDQGAGLDLCLDNVDKIRRKHNELSLSLAKTMLNDHSKLENLIQEQLVNTKKISDS